MQRAMFGLGLPESENWPELLFFNQQFTGGPFESAAFASFIVAKWDCHPAPTHISFLIRELAVKQASMHTVIFGAQNAAISSRYQFVEQWRK